MARRELVEALATFDDLPVLAIGGCLLHIGNTADAGADLLDGRHQRIAEHQRPNQPIANCAPTCE